MEVDVEVGDRSGVDGGRGGFRRGDGVGEETEDDVCGGCVVEEDGGGEVDGSGGRRATVGVLRG